MKYLSLLIKPASSRCNINCKYCFYSDVSDLRTIKDYGIMSEETSYNIIKKSLDHFKEEATITYAFQGGEPTLAKIDYFKTFVRLVNENKSDYHHINYSIQTNGTLLNKEWVHFFKDNNFLVGISLDGYKENHDGVRVKGKKGETYSLVMHSIKLLKEARVDFNILTVLTKTLAKNPKRLFNFYLKNDFKYIQLIPCLPSFESIAFKEYLRPKDFFNFYIEFFKLWKKEYLNKNYISVTYFDNIIPLFVRIRPAQCGYLGTCSMQFVIEGDGSVYTCDFYVMDRYKTGNINEDSILDIYKSKILKEFIEEDRLVCSRCETCRYNRICGGQCKRMSVCYYDKDYCGLQEFMRINEKSMVEIARSLVK